jgi:class 3 adenylate cyclase/tetratricopeptide (TPR) repeat protein
MWSAAMDVGVWLRGLGLGKYEEKFRDNAIDADLLPRLTGDHLKDIGVSALGDRLRLLDAIATLAGAKPAVVPTPPPKPAPPKGLQVSAERRPITVMFCDLADSTSLASKLDAEDWRNLVNAYLDEASKAVTGFGGHVLKRLGDGLMALFGYPQAQENDAERAVRAALAIQRSLAELNSRNARFGAPELSARIGLESGPVVAEAAGEVFGDAPNVAARVQAAADPGAVFVTASVQRQVAGLFVAEELGAHELKGVLQPVALYRIVRASGGGRRSRSRALSPLVGRAEELDLLTRRWERARSGQGQFVQIVGEPGIGKSRLVEEFHARLGETPHTWAEFSSSQLLQNTPLHPIAEWGRQRFGDADTPAVQRFADLENTLQLIGLDPAEHAPLIAPLVDIPLPPGRAVNLPPEELRRRQLAALVAWFLAGARSQPAALAFEDLHWADPTSLDLMQALAERGHQAPLLILATTRPEFRAPWSMRAHHSVISLSPLDRADVAQMVGELTARHALSKEVVQGVSERTGGVPLFVEEVTRLLLERGEAGGLQAIPPTLQQSLAARLDRLGEAREVAQIGAMLGRDFSYALLRAVAAPMGGVGDPALQPALDRLVDADLLFVEGAGTQATYRFKHALIQDAAYESLLKSRRQELHARIATEIEARFPQLVEAQPELVARHFGEAGLAEKSVPYWLRAGRLAAARSANMEAIAHLRSGLECAEALVPEASRSRFELSLQLALGGPLIATKGFASTETEAAFRRAEELSRELQSETDLFAALRGLGYVDHVRGNLRRATSLVEETVALAKRIGDPELLVEADFFAGMANFHVGHFQFALDGLERIMAAGEHGGCYHFEVYGINMSVLALAYISHCDWHLGYPVRSLKFAEEAVALAREISHPLSIAQALDYLAMLHQFRREPDAALKAAAGSLSICSEYGFDYYGAWSSLVRAWALAESGGVEEGFAVYDVAFEEFRRSNAGLRIPHHLCQLAALHRNAGEATIGLRLIDEAITIADANNETWCNVELHRERGELMLLTAGGEAEAQADAEFETGIRTATAQGAKLPELRASVARARLHAARGRKQKAREILAPIYGWFREGFETRDLAEARALLADLQ